MAREPKLADHERLLRAVAARLVGPDEADDIVQETFLRALTAAPDPSAPLAPWLVTVARNLAVDLLRRRGRLQVVEEVEVPDPAPERVPLTDLLPALGRLTESEVVVLLLREVLDFEIPEIAEVLDTSPGAVRVLHHRARHRERGSLDDALVAVERFLTWLLARTLAGMPVRAATRAGEPVWRAGVLTAHERLMDGMVEVTAAAGRDDLELKARIGRGNARRALGRLQEALADYERWVEVAGRLGRTLDRVAGRVAAAGLLARLGRRVEAREVAERGLAEADDSPRGRSLRIGLRSVLIQVAREEGRAEDAARLASETRAEAARTDLVQRVLAANSEGTVLLDQERWDEAEAAFAEAFALVREIGHVRNEAAGASNLGLCARGRGDLEGAAWWFDHARQCAAQVGDDKQLLLIDSNLADLRQLEGRFAEAAEAWERLLPLLRASGMVTLDGVSRMFAGILDHVLGRLDRAERRLGEALGLVDATQRPQVEAHLAAVLAERGYPDPARFERIRQGTTRAGLIAALPLLEAVGSGDASALDGADERIPEVRTAAQVLRAAIAREQRHGARRPGERGRTTPSPAGRGRG